MLASRCRQAIRHYGGARLPASGVRAAAAAARPSPFAWARAYSSPGKSFEEQVRERLRQAQRYSGSYRQAAREDMAREKLRSARPLVFMPSVLSGRGARWVRWLEGLDTRWFVAGCVGGAVLFYVANTQTVPVTGRRRFNVVGDGLMSWLGGRTADEVVREVEDQGARFLPERDWRARMVRRVMARLVPVSGMADRDWTVRVIDDDATVNAFVTPHNDVFVFSGLLRVCGNEDAVAAVLGHEIAHVVAGHAAERLSGAIVANFTSGSLFLLAGLLRGMALLGVWTFTGGAYLQNLLYELPMSRKGESEADYIGLMMMAEACYDPREAVSYWHRMNVAQARGGAEVPEMLSTHPSVSAVGPCCNCGPWRLCGLVANFLIE